MADTATILQILQLEERRFSAMREVDVAALDGLLDDTLTYVHSNGACDGKAGILEGIRSRRWVFRRTERENAEVRVIGGCAIVTGEVRFEIEVAGAARQLHSRFTDVWVERQDGWKMASWHATAMPKVE